MKALVCCAPGILEYQDIEAPEMEAGREIIRIRKTGICGTDFHAFKGNQPYFNYPRILGHELAGELANGEMVTFIPYYHCGECNACLRGKTNCCVKMQVCGVHVDGGMVEYLSVPSASIIKSNGLSADELALVEPLAIGAHGVRRADIQPGESVLIMGVGPIGLGLAAFAKMAGASVTAFDLNKERLAFCAEQLGVAVTNDAKDIVADVVMDATGNLAAINSGLQYLAHGGRYVLVGLQKEALSFSHPELHKREGTIMSSRNATRQDFEQVTQAIKDKTINPVRFITHRVHFSELKTLFENFPSDSIKVMVDY